MKKILSIILFLTVSFVIFAQQETTGYFTETSKGYVAKWDQDGYAYGISGYHPRVDSANTIASPVFGTSASNVRNGFMGSKIAVGIKIDTAFTDVAATLVSQISLDGSNWVNLETLDSDTTPNVTGTQIYLADFSSTKAPFARLLFNAGGAAILANTGRLKFLYAVPVE